MIGQAGFSTVPFCMDQWENPQMTDTKQTLRERLRQRLEFTGKSAHAVSKEIGANTGYVRDLLDPAKTGIPSAARLQALAAALGTTTDWLMGQVENPAQPISEVSFREVPNGWRGPKTDGIPLLGTGYCDDLAVEGEDGGMLQVERVQLEMDHVIRMIHRPAALFAARDAYAIYFHGSSMEPRYFPGDIGIADPRRPPSPGDFVVVQLNDGTSDSVITVLVKRLVRQTSAFIELEQYNPEQQFKIPRRQVARMHRIFLPSELLI